MPRRGPDHLRACVAFVSKEDARRLSDVYLALGRRRCAKTLGMGEGTIDAAMQQGRLLKATHDRLLAALARYEEGRAAS